MVQIVMPQKGPRAQVMPLLRHILENATDRPHALLRAKALECISLVGMAVGRARFRDDAARVMQLMQALQARPPMAPADNRLCGSVSIRGGLWQGAHTFCREQKLSRRLAG